MSKYLPILIIFILVVALVIYEKLRGYLYPWFPRKTGPYQTIGVRLMRFSPHLRAKVYYPAYIDNNEVKKFKQDLISSQQNQSYLKIKNCDLTYSYEPYLTEKELSLYSLCRAFEVDKWKILHLKHSRSSCIINAPIVNSSHSLQNNNKFPVIVYSHGLGATFDVALSVILDIVSHGFIVISLEHADGSAAVTRLSSGAILLWDGYKPQEVPYPTGADSETNDTVSPNVEEIVEQISTFRREQLQHRVNDVLCCLDQLFNKCKPKQLSLINIENNILHTQSPIEKSPTEKSPTENEGDNNECNPQIYNYATKNKKDSFKDTPEGEIPLPSFLNVRRIEDNPLEDTYHHLLEFPVSIIKHMDFNNIILMGHSYGGGTVLNTAYTLLNESQSSSKIKSEDIEKIRCVVLHDPWFEPLPKTMQDSIMKIPILTILSDQFQNHFVNNGYCMKKVLKNCHKWVKTFYIKGTRHVSFNDCGFFGEQLLIRLMKSNGSLSPAVATDYINRLSRTFIAKYLHIKNDDDNNPNNNCQLKITKEDKKLLNNGDSTAVLLSM